MKVLCLFIWPSVAGETMCLFCVIVMLCESARTTESYISIEMYTAGNENEKKETGYKDEISNSIFKSYMDIFLQF